jgi:hypothetical protein
MATEKISATVDQDVVDEIRELVGPRGVSSFLTEAAREKLQRARILTYLKELDDTYGEPDARDRKLAKRKLAKVLEP